MRNEGIWSPCREQLAASEHVRPKPDTDARSLGSDVGSARFAKVPLRSGTGPETGFQLIRGALSDVRSTDEIKWISAALN